MIHHPDDDDESPEAWSCLVCPDSRMGDSSRAAHAQMCHGQETREIEWMQVGANA